MKNFYCKSSNDHFLYSLESKQERFEGFSNIVSPFHRRLQESFEPSPSSLNKQCVAHKNISLCMKNWCARNPLSFRKSLRSGFPFTHRRISSDSALNQPSGNSSIICWSSAFIYVTFSWAWEKRRVSFDNPIDWASLIHIKESFLFSFLKLALYLKDETIDSFEFAIDNRIIFS